MIKACIFDLDGVIVDTAKYHYLAWRRLAADLGFDFGEADNQRLKGVSRMRSLDILLEVGGMAERFSEREREEMAARKNAWYLDYIMKMTPQELLPGAAEFVERLRAMEVGVALGSASKNARLILERVGIEALFDVIVDGTLVAAAKPDPEVFIKGAELLEVRAAMCVVFEDAPAGVEAAHRAGMRCVGVGSAGQLPDADALIDGFAGFTPEKLEEILGERILT